MVKLWRKSWFTAAPGCWSIQSLGDARGAHLYILFVIKWTNLTWMSLRQRCIVAFAHRFHYIITFKKLQATQQNNSSGSTVRIKNKKPSDLPRIIHVNSSQSGASRLRMILWSRNYPSLFNFHILHKAGTHIWKENNKLQGLSVQVMLGQQWNSTLQTNRHEICHHVPQSCTKHPQVTFLQQINENS